ncbi:unnamed protein product [Allacma fusca]|uniref:Tyrosine specific protein phosphatases domain-containing protein n=1 Tax=Allacma fusca TaxID=39272 RepID=A0A8J2M820_9HEXA|nr:unnamed protein product [Allacma fusca]
MLPEGWKESPNMALGLIENIFFPFKTPLNKTAGNFTIDDVFDHAKEQKWSIGLWVDLTNTKKYYNPSLVESKGVQYVKLAVAGRQSPSMHEITSFNNVCNQFLTENPDKIIGIHCTHGFNRTGFLICSFLSQVKKLDVHSALKKFAELRPPGIYRQNMVNDIVGYFGSLGCPPAPKVSNPPWKVGNTYRKNAAMNGNIPENNSGKVNKNSGRTQCRMPHMIRKFCPGETFQEYIRNYSIEVATEMRASILEDVSILTNRTSSESFVGSEHRQCTELEFEILKSEPYMVSWFPEEYFRYLLYFDAGSRAYLIDSSNRVYALPGLIFPSCTSPSGCVFSTVIEGIILRKYVSTIEGCIDAEYHFEMCDVEAFEGQNLTAQSLGSRLKLLRDVLEARKSLGYAKLRIRSFDLPSDPFRIRIQPMWSASHFWKLQRFDWFHSYPIGPNALIFYPSNSAESKDVKWMCPTTNTTCFRLLREFLIKESDPVPVTVFRLYTDDREVYFDELKYATDEDFNLYDSFVGSIIKCEFDNATGGWKVKRQADTRIWSDTFEFAQNVRSGELSKNVPTKLIFDYYGSQKQLKRVNTRWSSEDQPKGTVNAIATISENDSELKGAILSLSVIDINSH